LPFSTLVTTVYGIGTADGLNEKGLGAHSLFLKAVSEPSWEGRSLVRT